MNNIWTKEDEERYRHIIMRMERMYAVFTGGSFGHPEILQTRASMKEAGLLNKPYDMSKYKEDIDWLRKLPTRFDREPRFEIGINGELIDRKYI